MKNNRYTFMVSIFVLFGSLTLLLSLFLISNFYLRGLDQSYKMRYYVALAQEKISKIY